MDKERKDEEEKVSNIMKRLSSEFKNGKLITDVTLELTTQLEPIMEGTNILTDAVGTLLCLAKYVPHIEQTVALQLSWSCDQGAKGYFCALATAILVVELVYPEAEKEAAEAAAKRAKKCTEKDSSTQTEDSAIASTVNDITEQLNNSLRELAKHTENLETFGSLLSQMESLRVSSTPSPVHSTTKPKERLSPVELITAPGIYKCIYGLLTWTEGICTFVGPGREAKVLNTWYNAVSSPPVKCIVLNTSLDSLLMIAELHKRDFLTFTCAKSTKDKKNAFDILFPLFTRCTYQWCIQNF